MPISNLMRRDGSQLASRDRGRLSRPVTRQIEAVRGSAVVSAARVNAAAYVTHTALTFTAQLSAEESRLIETTPLGEARYKAIVDHFTGVACAEIAGMSW